MDINMRNVVIGKEKEGSNWIAIGEALNPDGKTVKNGTKLMYWDGVQNTECYKQSFINIAVDSKFDYYGDMLGTADY